MSSVKTRIVGSIFQAMSIRAMPSTPPAALIARRGWNVSIAHASRSCAEASSNRSAASCTHVASSSMSGSVGSWIGWMGSRSATGTSELVGSRKGKGPRMRRPRDVRGAGWATAFVGMHASSSVPPRSDSRTGAMAPWPLLRLLLVSGSWGLRTEILRTCRCNEGIGSPELRQGANVGGLVNPRGTRRLWSSFRPTC